MQMDFGHWMALESAMHGEEPRRRFDPAILRRIAIFARPHWRGLGLFLGFSVATALLTVATPVLAGQVVDEITSGRDQGRVVTLAIVIALLALLDAAVSIGERWQSARIGEGLILDLRRAVFGHVQRMPVAFFTRTRTGALVSRLNNDVIGAQRAFTWTLSGVVSNSISLLLASWSCCGSPGRSPCWRWCCCRSSSSPPGAWAPAWPTSSERRPTTTRP